MEIVEPANSKKNNNIKANDFNLISMARSADQLYVAFNVFCRVRHPLEKYFPMNPPPPPWNNLPGEGVMDIFWNHMLKYS